MGGGNGGNAPGAITLDRTPKGPTSTARTLDKASTAAFALETWAWYGIPSHRKGASAELVQSQSLWDKGRQRREGQNLGSEVSPRWRYRTLGSF